MTELREAQNSVEIIGTVKKINLKESISKNNKEMIIGDVLVEVKDGNLVNNIKVKILSMKLNKAGAISGLYKGYKTVLDEWTKGDRVRVTGSIGLNQYFGQDGELRKFNEVRGLFLNRLEGADAEKPDKAIATVEIVVENMTSELDNENIPTGMLNVEAFTVGYNSKIETIENLKIGENLAKVFSDMYYPGSTGRVTFKINNFAEMAKEEIAPQEMAGFGNSERVEDNVVTNYESFFEIIGGDLPYTDGVNNYSADEIEQAHRNIELTLQALKQESSAPTTPQSAATGFGNNGFGNKAADDLTKTFTNEPVDMPGNDDVPAF